MGNNGTKKIRTGIPLFEIPVQQYENTGIPMLRSAVPPQFLKDCATHLISVGDADKEVYAPYLTPYCLAMQAAMAGGR